MNIPHNCPTFNRKESRAVRLVIKSGWVAQRRKVQEFEDKFCEYMGLPQGHAVAVSSGSAALFIAILALEAKGQKIGLPVYTCAAVNNAVTFAGGRSVLLDNTATGPNLDVNIADQSELHTLISVSTFGIPLAVSTYRNYRVIEDISQALGAVVQGRKLGLHGDLGICSFSATKLITSGGQGGMIFSTNTSLVQFAQDYRNFDAREDRLPRFNFQMTDTQAAIGIVQLTKLPSFLQKREEIFNIYSEKGLDLIKETDTSDSPSRYRAVIRSSNPLDVQEKLYQKGIATIVPFTFKELLSTSNKYKNAVNLTKSTLSIPIYPSLSLQQTVKIAKSVKSSIGSL
jgi:perosamine synthetase